MNTITRLVVYLALSATLATAQGQNKELDSIKKEKVGHKISLLEEDRAKIEEQEKEILKLKITKINKQLDNKEITAEEAENLKKEAAKQAALNIENRNSIINYRIDLLKRNGFDRYEEEDDSFIGVRENGEGSYSIGIKLGKDKARAKKYDRRTTTDVVFAIGFNNALIEGQDLDDSPYKIGRSDFLELGYAWKTRIFENTNFWRLKYGFSFQWNKFEMKDNNFIVNTDGEISLQEFPSDLSKAKFRTTNLVFPVHLEFGPSKKIEKENYFRYSTYKKLKIGLGGYAGLNIGSMQKLKYKEDGNRIKDKQRGGFEVSEFVYGVSGYVALGDIALYVKYDLNPLFKDQVVDQNNISVGIRFDMD